MATTDSDAGPVGETALARDRLLHLLATHLVAGQEMTEHDRRLCDAALVAYRDAVAAEARAALLRDAPVVWVATDSDGTSGLYEQPPLCDEGEREGDNRVFYTRRAVLDMPRNSTPPGTVRRYALVPHPEGEETPT